MLRILCKQQSCLDLVSDALCQRSRWRGQKEQIPKQELEASGRLSRERPYTKPSDLGSVPGPHMVEGES